MVEIRKAKIIHKCLACQKDIKPKERYIQISKQKSDSYLNGAICKNCVEEIILEKLEE